MFRKKRPKPWFFRTLANLVAVTLIYRVARGFQKIAQKQGATKK